MTATFNAREFVASVKQGKLDGRLVEELRKLSDGELEDVVGLIVDERMKTTASLSRAMAASASVPSTPAPAPESTSATAGG